MLGACYQHKYGKRSSTPGERDAGGGTAEGGERGGGIRLARLAVMSQ